MNREAPRPRGGVIALFVAGSCSSLACCCRTRKYGQCFTVEA